MDSRSARANNFIPVRHITSHAHGVRKCECDGACAVICSSYCTKTHCSRAELARPWIERQLKFAVSMEAGPLLTDAGSAHARERALTSLNSQAAIPTLPASSRVDSEVPAAVAHSACLNSYPSRSILLADAPVFRRGAQLMHRRPDHHLEDVLIAATAFVRGLTVVTRNVDDFEPCRVSLLNPFIRGSGATKSG